MGNHVSSPPEPEEEREVLTPLSTPLLTLDFDIKPASLPQTLLNDTNEKNSLQRSQEGEQQQQHEDYSPSLYNHIKKKNWTEAKLILDSADDNDTTDNNIRYIDLKTNHTVLNYTNHYRDIPDDIFQSILTACCKYDNNDIFLFKSRIGGWTPLQWSIVYSTPTNIMAMINACPMACSVTNDDGATPLHVAARAMSTDRWRMTPLRRAIVYTNNSTKKTKKKAQDERSSSLIRHESSLLTTTSHDDDDDDNDDNHKLQEIIQALVLAHPSGVTAKDVDGNTPFDIFFESWSDAFLDSDDVPEENVALRLEEEVVNSQVSRQGKKLKWVCDIAALLLGIRGGSFNSGSGGRRPGDDTSSAGNVLSLLKLLCKAKLSEQQQQQQQHDGDGSSSSSPPETSSIPSVLSSSSNNNNTVEFQYLEKYMKKVECHI